MKTSFTTHLSWVVDLTRRFYPTKYVGIECLYQRTHDTKVNKGLKKQWFSYFIFDPLLSNRYTWYDGFCYASPLYEYSSTRHIKLVEEWKAINDSAVSHCIELSDIIESFEKTIKGKLRYSVKNLIHNVDVSAWLPGGSPVMVFDGEIASSNPTYKFNIYNLQNIKL